MTSIASNTLQSKNLFTPSVNAYSSAQNNTEHNSNEDKSIGVFRKIFNKDELKPYEGPVYPNLPGMTSLLSDPFDYIHSMNGIKKGVISKDHEEVLDASSRFLGVHISSLAGIGATVSFINRHKEIHNSGLMAFSALSLFFGLILCAIEMIVESISAKRQGQFIYKNFSINDIKGLDENMSKADLTKWIKKVEKNPERYLEALTSEEVLNFIPTLRKLLDSPKAEVKVLLDRYREKVIYSKLKKLSKRYFQLNPSETTQLKELSEKEFPKLSKEESYIKLELMKENALKRKMVNLSRRIRPWCVAEISGEIHEVLKNLTSPNQKIRENAAIKGAEILKNIDIQAKKKLLVHIIGIIAIGIFATGLILSSLAVPFLVPAILFGVGMTVALGRYLFYRKVLDSKRWHVIPKKIEETPKALPIRTYSYPKYRVSKPRTHYSRRPFYPYLEELKRYHRSQKLRHAIK